MSLLVDATTLLLGDDKVHVARTEDGKIHHNSKAENGTPKPSEIDCCNRPDNTGAPHGKRMANPHPLKVEHDDTKAPSVSGDTVREKGDPIPKNVKSNLLSGETKRGAKAPDDTKAVILSGDTETKGLILKLAGTSIDLGETMSLGAAVGEIAKVDVKSGKTKSKDRKVDNANTKLNLGETKTIDRNPSLAANTKLISGDTKSLHRDVVVPKSESNLGDAGGTSPSNKTPNAKMNSGNAKSFDLAKDGGERETKIKSGDTEPPTAAKVFRYQCRAMAQTQGRALVTTHPTLPTL